MFATPPRCASDYWKPPHKSRQNPLLAGALGLLFTVGLCACRHGPRPNVLLITVDTLRFDRLGCYGFELARTPNIDALAADGIRCTDAITVAPITLPAHTSILTGLFPPAHGVRDNGVYAVPDDVVTLPERLKKAGYRTQAFVSAIVLGRRYNLTQGFDGYDDDLWAEDTPPLFMIRDRPAAKTAARVVEWLTKWHEAPQGAPFFVWVHFFDPHQPYKPPFVDRILAPTLYDAEIAASDRGIGRILDTLKEQGVLDDTLVIFTADHGESLGDHDEQTHGVFIYDATVHVPLIWRYPRLLAGGKAYNGPVRAVDIVPTVLGVLGLGGGEQTQGKDLRWALRGWTSPPDLPQYSESLLSEVGFGMAPLYAIRHHGYKWIRAPKPEVYNLAADPGELNNLYTTEAARAGQLDKELDHLVAESSRLSVAARQNPLDQETAEMMRALGYLAPAAERTSLHGMDPKDGIALRNKLEDARHLEQRQDWLGAEQLLREILDGHPANVSARNILGLALLRQDRLDDAEREYLASLAVDPNQHRVHAMLGTVYLKRRDLDAAERAFREALAMSPAFVEAMGHLGFIEAQRGHPAAAQQWYEKAIAADPGFPHVYRRFADLYYEQGDFAAALSYYRKTLEMLPDHFEAMIQAGNCGRQTGDLPIAAEYYERAARLRPDSWIPPYNLACLRAVSGDAEQALVLLSEAVQKGFNRPGQIEENPDLISLHGRPDYQDLLAKLRAARAKADNASGRARATNPLSSRGSP